MTIYLAAAMTHRGRDVGAIAALLECLEAEGHRVPTRHVADPRGRDVEGQVTDTQVARRDLAWVDGCDALVAEVSTPSHGVGVEVAVAVAAGKPVLLAFRRGVQVSRLLLGLEGVERCEYATLAEACRGVRGFLGRLRPAAGAAAR